MSPSDFINVVVLDDYSTVWGMPNWVCWILIGIFLIVSGLFSASENAFSNCNKYHYKVLAEEADKRLKAIKEFTEFGSGFKIAMRDLEIRGAGSLIGEIQHGHLEEVGYDTYCRLLDEVLKEEQGIEVKPEFNVQIDLNVTSYIPDSYISDSNQKIEIYQDIALCKDEKDIEDIIDELVDRFGDIPHEVESLLEISRIKQLAKKVGIEKIAGRNNSIVFTFDNDLFNNSKVNEIVKKYGNKVSFSPGIKPVITLKINTESEEYILKETKNFLENYLQEERKLILYIKTKE